jgi:hypothetical protein
MAAAVRLPSFADMQSQRATEEPAACASDILSQYELAFCAKQPCGYNVSEVCSKLQSVVTGLDGGQPLSEDKLCR